MINQDLHFSSEHIKFPLCFVEPFNSIQYQSSFFQIHF